LYVGSLKQMTNLKRPELKDISATLINHYQYYSGVRAETCEQQLRHEKEISQQYSGRALFELVQNAFDHCDKKVVVLFKEDDQGCKLIVGNDGKSLSVDPNYDYDAWNPTQSRKRSDFHALCSLSTSNKNPDESIGHKGIGFKSVFSMANNVQIWSRIAGSEKYWWGIEFHKEMSAQLFKNRIKRMEVKKGFNKLLDDNYGLFPGNHHKLIYPSFYYPLPLWRETNFKNTPEVKEMVTFVIVPVETNRKKDVIGSIEELQNSHLYFVGKRKPEVEMLTKINNSSPVKLFSSPDNEIKGFNYLAVWPGHVIPTRGAYRKLKKMAEAAELDISTPGVAVFWGDNYIKAPGGEDCNNLLYCYLPTRMEAAFNVDYNGDFQIGIDRATLNLDENNNIGLYNRALLEAATEVHLAVLLYALGFSERRIKGWTEWRWLQHKSRKDFDCLPGKPEQDEFSWRLLDPVSKTESQKVSVEHMKKLLFFDVARNDIYYAKWAELARLFFNKKRGVPLSSYSDFWNATANWLDYIFHYYNRGTKKWREKASYMCDALREEKAKVVPIIEEFIEHDDNYDEVALIKKSIMLPDRREKDAAVGRANVRVFVRRDSEGEAATIQLPQAVLDRGRAITTYSFPYGLDDSSPRPTGVVDLERWALLQELQQLPTNVKDFTTVTDHHMSQKHQYEILKFAAQLYVAGFGTHKSLQDQAVYSEPGWRVNQHESEEARGAGRALATLFLPTREDLWEPARQLTPERIAKNWKNKILKEVPGLDINKFLRFLGVSPQEEGLLLVENGEDNLVKATATIPPLVEPTPSVRIPPLKPVFSNSNKTRAQMVKEAWPWFSNLVASETESTGEEEKKTGTEICETLGKRAWFPVTGEGEDNTYASAPSGAVSVPMYIEPKRIVIQPDLGDIRRFRVLWRVKQRSPYSEILTALGAKKNLAKDSLEADGASAAVDLIKQLKELDLTQLKNQYQARQGLIELYKYLFEIIVDVAYNESTKNIPILIYKGNPAGSDGQKSRPLIDRNLVWAKSSKQKWWLARNNEQQELLRRFYPELDLAVATTGPKRIRNVKWLRNKLILLKRKICYKPDQINIVEGKTVKGEIAPLLPGLLALAQSSRLFQEEVNVVEVKKRWDGLNFISYSNVWEEISTDQPDMKPQQWLKDVCNVVLFYTRDDKDLPAETNGARSDKENLNIYFDKAPDKNAFPPLRYFARALAEKLLNNLSLEGLFAQALTEYQDGGKKCFQEYLEKNGVLELSYVFQQRLNPLTEKEDNYFKNNLIEALRNVGCCLKVEKENASFSELRYLRTSDICPAQGKWGKLTEQDIKASLKNGDFRIDGVDFTPEFDCYSENLEKWESWLDQSDRKERVLCAALGEDEYLSAEGKVKAEMLDELKTYVYSQLNYLAFSPEKTALDWLRNKNAALAAAEKTKSLEELLPRVPVVRPVEYISSGNWKPVKLEDDHWMQYPLEPGQGDQGIKMILGREAEDALCALVVSQTLEILKKYATAWQKLISITEKGWRVRDELEKAHRNINHLKKALHVSEYWGNAGFDIIGLEEDEQHKSVRAVLYEVKAITGEYKSKVHISRNQLKTYEKYYTGEKALDGACWKLIGVEPNGSAEDLTAYIGWLLDCMKSGALKQLHDHGFKPEGFILTLNRNKLNI